jgi:nitrite reductase/ring-hydroxylating ferredoxin subunit
VTAPPTDPAEALAATAALADGEARVLTLPDAEGDPVSVLVLRWKGTLRAYRNRCPHNGVRLDFIPGEVWTRDGRSLRCGTHGARFRPDSGRCFSGPCRGDSLTPIPLTIDDTGRPALVRPPAIG